MNQIELHRFWGKTPKNGDPPERFHPAIHHMLDVACSAHELLRTGSPRLRGVLEHAWRGSNLAVFIECLPLIVALHDIGKISAAFQGQATNTASLQQRDRLVGEGIKFRKALSKPLYHQEISALWIHGELPKYESNLDRRLRWVLRDAISGHHGHFAEQSYAKMKGLLDATERGEMPWEQWRVSTFRLVRELLLPSQMLAEIGVPDNLRAATVALTGFIVWADWIGSNEKDFTARPALLPREYLGEARKCASAATALHHLHTVQQDVTYRGFSTLFPTSNLRPRPLQELVDKLPEEVFSQPTLIIVEAPTGEGKTETALALSRRMGDALGYEEVFFALPTMASGNQMFTRLEHFFRDQYGAAVRLTHSQAPVLEEDLRKEVLSDRSGEFEDTVSSPAAALEWFAGSKKAILAPLGVGTVDQVELAGLNVRHYSLRLFAFARRVVVIDEVHAYDAYMSTILDHALQWLSALGASVVLLSATLPANRHRSLARSFLQGLGSDRPSTAEVGVDYPLMAIYNADDYVHHKLEPFRSEQQIALRFSQIRDYAGEAQHLLDLVRDGGAVARICNRVDDAQGIYRELMAQAGAYNAILIHARFPLDDRKLREQQIQRLLGKETERTPEQRIIIVGTQVLEQSLDYDVDVMVSDFAPIDLLLQRAGRLHRHFRRRPARHSQPVLEVALAHAPDQAPDWTRWSPIYAAYVLWRTWEVLSGHEMGTRMVRLPADYRTLIEAVYTDPATAITHPRYEREIQRARQEHLDAIDAMKAQARTVLNPAVMMRGPITEDAGLEFVEEEAARAADLVAKTRLGDRVTVVPIFNDNGRWALDNTFSRVLSLDIAPYILSSGGLDQKDLLAAAVPLSDRRVISWYRRDDRPAEFKWPWREIPSLLRSLQPLPLNQASFVVIEGRRLTLDRELGLVIEKEQL